MVFLEAIAVLPKPHMAIFVENNVYDYLRWINYAFTAHNWAASTTRRTWLAGCWSPASCPNRSGPRWSAWRCRPTRKLS